MLRIRTVELPVPKSPEGALEAFLDAASAGPRPDVVVLPELFSTGYVLERLPALAVTEDGMRESLAPRFSREYGCWLFAGTWPVMTESGLKNTLFVFDPDGNLAHRTEKAHLFRQMGEDSVFAPGTPSGVFDLGGTPAGSVVCYDLRFPELSRRLTLAGARIVFVPAQWPEARQDLFRCLLRARSAEAQVFFVGCNIGGEHLGVRFGGGGGVAHPSGDLVKPEETRDGVKDYIIDPADVGRMRQKVDCLRDRRPEVYSQEGKR
jgi:predicted amidohydrolase